MEPLIPDIIPEERRPLGEPDPDLDDEFDDDYDDE